MKKDLNIEKEIQAAFEDSILKSISGQFKAYENFKESIEKGIGNVSEQDILSTDINKQKQLLTSLIQSKKAISGALVEFLTDLDNLDPDSNHSLSLFYSKTENIASEIPEYLVETQDIDRYNGTESDNGLIKTIKAVKKTWFQISRLTQVFKNAIRKIKKIPSRPLRLGKHRIPERALTRWFFQYEGSEFLLNHCDQADRELLNRLNEDFKVLDGIDAEIVNALLTTLNIEVENNIANTNDPEKTNPSNVTETHEVRETFSEESTKNYLLQELELLESKFRSSRAKVDTVELSAGKFDKEKLGRRELAIQKKYKEQTKGWRNAQKMVIEDWKLNVELYRAIYEIALLLTDHEIEVANKISDIENHLAETNNFHDSIKTRFLKTPKSRKELLASLNESKSEIIKLYTPQIRRTSNEIVKSSFAGILNKLESSVKRVVHSLPDQVLVTNSTIEGPIDDNEIHTVSPSELVFFESFPSLEASLKKAKLEVLKKTEEIKNEVESLAGAVDISFETAITALSEESLSADEPISILMESIERASTKILEIKAQFGDIKTSTNEVIESTSKNFSSSLLILTKNENIYELRFRVAKAKAVAKSSKLKGQILRRFGIWLRSGSNRTVDFFKKSTGLLFQIQNRFFRTINEAAISTEVSNFLAESEGKIKKLPFIYQRLFSNEPVSDHSRFIGRENEMGILNDAINKWKQGKYAATIILGERGSGSTSFINHILEKHQNQLSVTYFNSERRIYDTDILIERFCEVLNLKADSVDSIIENLTNQKRKRIVVIEDLHYFFLRKVGGFECLKAIQKIITATGETIFWLVNSSIFTWAYLQRATGLSHCFEYTIRINNMVSDQIMEVIENRNRISGYTIQFLPSDEERKSKKLRNLDETEAQEFLRKKYFESLNKFAKSNLSLSLLYWQLSVFDVSEEIISVKLFNHQNLNFLSSFDKQRIFIMQAIVLHESLTAHELGEVLSMPEIDSQIEMLTLYEDGILMKENDSFVVNPLIFRQTITYLNSQNLLAS